MAKRLREVAEQLTGRRLDLLREQTHVIGEAGRTFERMLGDPVTVGYPDGVTEQPTVGAIYANDNVTASGGIVLHRDAFLSHTSRPADVNMLIKLTDGVPISAGEAAVQRLADRFGGPRRTDKRGVQPVHRR